MVEEMSDSLLAVECDMEEYWLSDEDMRTVSNGSSSRYSCRGRQHTLAYTWPINNIDNDLKLLFNDSSKS